MSRLKLDYTKDFLKELADLPPKHFKQVVSRVLALTGDPLPADSKQLQGHGGLRRVDSGEYRIIYDITDEAVRIILIGKRNDDEVYRLLERKSRS
jgi:mRNA interferase RelE/StbE